MTERVIEELQDRVTVCDELDIVIARKHACTWAHQAALDVGRTASLATAVSEVARNIIVHATKGEILLGIVHEERRRGIVVVARDGGPGIANVELAMQDGFSTAKSLGLGLSSARRLMDEFEIRSAPGEGTTVTMKKWVE